MIMYIWWDDGSSQERCLFDWGEEGSKEDTLTYSVYDSMI